MRFDSWHFSRTRAGVALLLAGCSSAQDSDAPYGSAQSSIVGGTDSDDSQDAVVRVTAKIGGDVSTCTGTMIAPNLVLTARHCVSNVHGDVHCPPDGSGGAGGFDDDTDPSQLYVYVGKSLPLYRNPNGRDKPNGIGAKFIHDGGSPACGPDVALVVLQEPITGVKTSPIRLDAPPTKGEALLAIGWGRTVIYTTPPVRQQREVSVAWVGKSTPTEYSSTTASEFATDEGGCLGDSGGPALATSTGAVVGITSRSRGSPGGGNMCIGPEVRVVYSHPAGVKDLIMKGFEAAGAVPWLEGQANPHLAKSGAICTKNDECLSNACLAVGNKQVCAPTDCKSEACPSGYACKAGNAGKFLCEAVPKAPKPTVIEETSCTFNGGGVPSGTSLLVALVSIAAGFVARRRSRTRAKL